MFFFSETKFFMFLVEIWWDNEKGTVIKQTPSSLLIAIYLKYENVSIKPNVIPLR